MIDLKSPGKSVGIREKIIEISCGILENYIRINEKFLSVLENSVKNHRTSTKNLWKHLWNSVNNHWKLLEFPDISFKHAWKHLEQQENSGKIYELPQKYQKTYLKIAEILWKYREHFATFHNIYQNLEFARR